MTRRSAGLLAASVLLVAINLRGPIVAVSPLVGRVQAELAMSGAVAGLLTSLPVLCFALASPAASWLIARVGLERALTVGLAVIGTGTVVRSLGGTAVALGGTVLVGIGITVGNVAVPVVIGRDFPRRSGAMLGAYTAVMNLGTMATLALMVPLADVTGWRVALGSWALVAVVAAVVWTTVTRTPTGAAGTERAPGAGPGYSDWWRRPVVWALTAAFGGQSFSYYGLTAWLPAILADLRGQGPTAAALSSSLFQVAAIAGALLVPLVHARTGSLRAAFAVVAVCWLLLPIGLLVAPGAWAVWCALGGFAQGGGFTVIFSAMLARSRDLVENRRVSALVQGCGYALAATGPAVVGGVHDLTGGWTAPLLVVLGALLVLSAAGLGATRRTSSVRTSAV